MTGATSVRNAQGLVLAVAILASFVAFLDGSVITVALPAIERELGGGLAAQQWIVDAYLITLGSLILLAGSLSDLLGRVLILRLGLIGFGVASVLCAAAPTAEVLILARALQGVAGALLVPSSLALITASFRGGEQTRAIGAWTAWTSASFIAGPLVGGIFVDLASWRLVFLINVLPIAVTLWLLALLGPGDARARGVRIDYPGAVLGVLGLGGPVFALIEQENLGWTHPLILTTLIGGVLALAGFLVRQHLAAHPMMPLSLFRVRNFWVGNIATALVYGGLSLGGFVVVVYLQQTAGFGATLAGLALMPVTVFSIALSSWVGALSGRFGARIFMTVGPILAGTGHLLMLAATPPVDYWLQLLPGVLLFGLGLTVTVAPLTSALLGSISSAQAGIGSAINNAIARVAGLVAIALAGLVIGAAGLDVEGYRRGLIATAALMIAGGLVSWIGIRTPRDATAVRPAGGSPPSRAATPSEGRRA